MIELDDSDVISTATLVVTFTDREERWGPAPRTFAELVKEQLDADPPDGFLSAAIEDDKGDGLVETFDPYQPRDPAGSPTGGQLGPGNVTHLAGTCGKQPKGNA